MLFTLKLYTQYKAPCTPGHFSYGLTHSSPKAKAYLCFPSTIPPSALSHPPYSLPLCSCPFGCRLTSPEPSTTIPYIPYSHSITSEGLPQNNTKADLVLPPLRSVSVPRMSFCAKGKQAPSCPRQMAPPSSLLLPSLAPFSLFPLHPQQQVTFQRGDTFEHRPLSQSSMASRVPSQHWDTEGSTTACILLSGLSSYSCQGPNSTPLTHPNPFFFHIRQPLAESGQLRGHSSLLKRLGCLFCTRPQQCVSQDLLRTLFSSHVSPLVTSAKTRCQGLSG